MSKQQFRSWAYLHVYRPIFFSKKSLHFVLFLSFSLPLKLFSSEELTELYLLLG